MKVTPETYLDGLEPGLYAAAQQSRTLFKSAFEEVKATVRAALAEQAAERPSIHKRINSRHAETLLDELLDKTYWRGYEDGTAAPKKAADQAAERENLPTREMAEAYLKANDAYWREVDSAPRKLGIWRDGTPIEATMVSLRAAFAEQAAAQRKVIVRAEHGMSYGNALAEQAQPVAVTDDMVSRFLCWHLPDDFAPDCGISFTKLSYPNSSPTGTNLLNATQARQMLEYVLAAAPKEEGK